MDFLRFNVSLKSDVERAQDSNLMDPFHKIDDFNGTII